MRNNRSEFVAHRELKHASVPVTKYKRRRSRDGSWALALLRIFGLGR